MFIYDDAKRGSPLRPEVADVWRRGRHAAPELLFAEQTVRLPPGKHYCPDCGGTMLRRTPRGPSPCLHCGGRGWLDEAPTLPAEKGKCPCCLGAGQLHVMHGRYEPCPRCGATGWVREKTLPQHVPYQPNDPTLAHGQTAAIYERLAVSARPRYGGPVAHGQTLVGNVSRLKRSTPQAHM